MAEGEYHPKGGREEEDRLGGGEEKVNAEFGLVERKGTNLDLLESVAQVLHCRTPNTIIRRFVSYETSEIKRVGEDSQTFLPDRSALSL